jgi:hypothetical protein
LCNSYTIIIKIDKDELGNFLPIKWNTSCDTNKEVSTTYSALGIYNVCSTSAPSFTANNPEGSLNTISLATVWCL